MGRWAGRAQQLVEWPLDVVAWNWRMELVSREKVPKWLDPQRQLLEMVVWTWQVELALPEGRFVWKESLLQLLEMVVWIW